MEKNDPLRDIRQELRAAARPEKAKLLQRFFKTGPGEYAEGDIFLGVMVPDMRRVARRFRGLPLGLLKRLLASPYHEERLAALIILVDRFNRSDAPAQKKIYDLYLASASRINNWDLVDISAPHIVGGYLEARGRRILYTLAASPLLWERRIAILATFRFIRKNSFDDSFRIARLLLRDEEDLIHKAVGWMLREAGKRDKARLESFLKRHAHDMPRTMLRYAIEKFPEERRRAYLAMKAIKRARPGRKRKIS